MPTRETHEGYVTDNNDPEKRGRLKVRCQTIVAGEDLDWVEPSFPYVDSEGSGGWIFIPEIGSSITVTINTGDEYQVTDLQPRWKCDLIPEGSFPEDFEDNYPKRRGFATPGGHVLYFDDTEDSQTMLYKHPSGTEIFVSDSGQIELRPTGNESVLIGAGATEEIPLGTQLKSLLELMKTTFDGHVHLAGTPPGNTDIPTTLFPHVTRAILSDNHKVK
jgi:hypothetical protein